jgi:hypothetical protein
MADEKPHEATCKHPKCCKCEASVALIIEAPGLCVGHHVELSRVLRARMREYMLDIGYGVPTSSEETVAEVALPATAPKETIH